MLYKGYLISEENNSNNIGFKYSIIINGGVRKYHTFGEAKKAISLHLIRLKIQSLIEKRGLRLLNSYIEDNEKPIEPTQT
ncbi:MAG: hypothetical protein PF437_10510 [Sulfurimonas sp.]|nr:hypothetical protein [Sulfurimonas sp.]